MSPRDLGNGCTASWTTDVFDLHLPGGAATVQLARDGARVRARLRYAGGKTAIDVSFQPAAVEEEIVTTARECGVDPNRWKLGTLAALRDWSGSLDWCPHEHDQLLAAVGALTHPLLQHVYERGHRASGAVPRWALGVLRAPDATTAARVLDPTATRRVSRALAASLVVRPAPAEVELVPLAYACAGAGLVSTDELANLLEAPLPPVRAELPDSEQIEEIRQVLGLYPPHRRAPLLLDAVRTTAPVEFAALMRRLWWIRDRAPQPLPMRVAEVAEVCARLVPVVAGPAPLAAPIASPRPTTPRPVTPPPTRPAPVVARPEPTPDERQVPDVVVRRPFERALPRPRVSLPVDVSRWPIPRALLPIHGFRHKQLHFVVPTSQVELRQWGRRLRNCLGDYSPAMAAGESWLIGVERDDALYGCVEILVRDRSLRQALGVRNQPLGDDVLPDVLEVLQLHRLTR